jgi:replicative DNA helicase
VEVSRPPFSQEAEEQILGAHLMDPTAFDRVSDILTPETFYYPQHQLVYKAIIKTVSNQMPVDIVTLAETLNDDGHLEAVGGRQYMDYLAVSSITTAHLEGYVHIANQKARLRRLAAVGQMITRAALEDDDPDKVLEFAQMGVFDAAQGKSQTQTQWIADAAEETIAKMATRNAENRELLGVSTGFKALDATLAGLQGSDLLILAARPSMGKTALALNIAANVSKEKPVLLFSLEMSKEQLTTRLLCSNAGIDSQRVRTCRLTHADFEALSFAASDMQKWKLTLDDTPCPSLMDIRTKARQASIAEPLGLIVIDYMQLMGGKGSDAVREMTAISRGLKLLARDLNVPILALSQLSRAVESRQDKKPMLSDLRESGAIEQDADVVMFIYRDEYYNPNTERPGMADVIVAKQRNGPLATIPLLFKASTTTFLNPLASSIAPMY